MSAMSDVFLRGGDCVEDVNRSECHLRESPEIRIPTSHTIGRQCTAVYKTYVNGSVGRESATSTVSTMTSDGSICHAPS